MCSISVTKAARSEARSATSSGPLPASPAPKRRLADRSRWPRGSRYSWPIWEGPSSVESASQYRNDAAGGSGMICESSACDLRGSDRAAQIFKSLRRRGHDPLRVDARRPRRRPRSRRGCQFGVRHWAGRRKRHRISRAGWNCAGYEEALVDRSTTLRGKPPAGRLHANRRHVENLDVRTLDLAFATCGRDRRRSRNRGMRYRAKDEERDERQRPHHRASTPGSAHSRTYPPRCQPIGPLRARGGGAGDSCGRGFAPRIARIPGWLETTAPRLPPP
jgi:hypothetical protein